MLKQFGKNEGSVKAGLDVWEVGWSPEKRTYCCKKHGVGCKSFNCEGDEPLWTLEERRWCCDMKGRGTDCRTVPPYDCKTDLRPKEDWPGAKRSWCCAKEGLGCGDGEGQPEQTAGGLFGWWPFSQATSQPQSSSEAKEIFNKMAKVIGDAADAQRVAKGGAAGETSAACRTECYLDTVVATCKDWVVDFSRSGPHGRVLVAWEVMCADARHLTSVMKYMQLWVKRKTPLPARPEHRHCKR
eukprot:symbB.v1.2.034409.t1/scaffold4436.1/size39690/3